ncbi:hypothetical protein CL629_03830 [bacterium]|nr:hypothetical protein [bacterium]|tara:strand:+ start:22754 stop:23206 length:453 start_codon:yes stop_codon:yes gene_type:complete
MGAALKGAATGALGGFIGGGMMFVATLNGSSLFTAWAMNLSITVIVSAFIGALLWFLLEREQYANASRGLAFLDAERKRKRKRNGIIVFALLYGTIGAIMAGGIFGPYRIYGMVAGAVAAIALLLACRVVRWLAQEERERLRNLADQGET